MLNKVRLEQFVCTAIVLMLVLAAPAFSENAITPDAFNARVLAIASEEFPQLNLQKTENPLLVNCSGGQLSLDNLYKVVTHETEPGTEDKEIRQFFKSITEISKQASTVKLAWSDVKSRIRPQIFPSSYLKSSKKQIISRSLPFSKKLLEGFVIDSENTFQYVTRDDLNAWKTDLDSLSKCAYENLDKIAQDLKFEVTEAGGKDARGKYITISIPDGYAAARILSADFRKRLQRDLGEPCFIAIPNRDFLIAWSTDFTHKEKFAQQVHKDFESRHHPLTAQIYEMEDGNLPAINVEASSDQEPTKMKTRRHRRHR